MAEKLTALIAGHSFDFVCNDKPKCPHCGEDFDIDESEAWFLYDEIETHEVECADCNLSFSVNSIARWSFSTDKQEGQQ